MSRLEGKEIVADDALQPDFHAILAADTEPCRDEKIGYPHCLADGPMSAPAIAIVSRYSQPVTSLKRRSKSGMLPMKPDRFIDFSFDVAPDGGG